MIRLSELVERLQEIRRRWPELDPVVQIAAEERGQGDIGEIYTESSGRSDLDGEGSVIVVIHAED